jgi:hypothetical protein
MLRSHGHLTFCSRERHGNKSGCFGRVFVIVEHISTGEVTVLGIGLTLDRCEVGLQEELQNYSPLCIQYAALIARIWRSSLACRTGHGSH